MLLIERFVSPMYKRTTNCLTLNETRREMFGKDGKDLITTPLPSGALIDYVRRASCRAGHMWSQASNLSQLLPYLENWGWSQLPEVSVAIKKILT